MDVAGGRDGPWMWLEVGRDHGCGLVVGRDGPWMWLEVGRDGPWMWLG